MAKDKSLGPNPVQKYNKKAKQAVINKSRNERSKQRDEQLQKRRPDQVQRQIDELRQLEAIGKLTGQDTQHLKSLERDLSRMHKLRAENKIQPVVTSERTQHQEKHVPARNSIPKDPTKSYYFDPIYNPFGVAPPGMEDKEMPEEGVDSDDSTASSTAEIPLPTGPPPVTNRYELLVTPTEHKLSNGALQLPMQKSRQPHSEALMPDCASEDSRSKAHRNKTQSRGVHQAQFPESSRVIYSAAPIIRNLQEESTVFVPKAIKRREGVKTAAKTDPLSSYATEDLHDVHLDVAEPRPAIDTSVVAKTKRRLNLAPAIT